jgi:hypothetical protein
MRSSPRFTPRNIIAVSLILLGAVVGLALASRSANDSPQPIANPLASDSRLTVGVIASRPAHKDETLRGLRLWLTKTSETGGIRYNARDLAAVRLVVEEADSAQTAQAAVAKLVKKGARMVVGPVDDDQLSAAADAARASKVAYMSPVPRPVSLPRSATMTFLARPPVGDFSPALDVLERLRAMRDEPSDRRRRLVIAATTGTWGLRAARAANGARARGYRVRLIRVAPGDVPPAASLRASRPDAVLVSAALSDALAWFRAGGGPARVPWILAAEDPRDVERGFRARVAAVVPWSPTSNRAGAVFGRGEMPELYRIAYGGTPSVDAAAGAAVGVVIQQMVQGARSTDPVRMLRARDRMKVESFWGSLSFVNGEQRPAPSAHLVLSGGNELVSIWPDPPNPPGLRRSVPAAPTPTPVPTVVPVPPNG